MNKIIPLIKNIGMYLLAMSIGILCIFPFYWIISLSFRSKSAIFEMPPKIVSTSFTLDNYFQAFNENNIGRFLFNSFYVYFNKNIF